MPVKGSWAEEVATRFYRKRGYKLIGRNIRGFGGEIDIALYKDDTVYLVEVKQRKYSLEDALFSVNRSKKQRILRAWYQKGGSYSNYPVILHVCAVIGTPDNYDIQIFEEEL